MNFLKTSLAGIAALFLTACSHEAGIPGDATATQEAAVTFPDYSDIYIPQNIAPLNFQMTSEGDDFVAVIKGKKGSVVAAADNDAKVCFDAKEWHALLDDNAHSNLEVTLYSHRNGQWFQHPSYALHVAEPIDSFLSYRLIEPGYELYRQLGLYQRDLTSFDERPIYENNRNYDSINNHCVNCHNYQAYDTQRMLFHVRAAHGGTIFVHGDKAEKWNMKSDSVLSNCVYPSWHPTRNWVVFSSNQTGQAFHIKGKEKIEVMDFGSDLVFFDADTGVLTNILKTEEDLETFPCWAPDGKKVYYCSAHVPGFRGLTSSQREDYVLQIQDSIRYNIMSITFDPATRTFGAPQLEVDCAATGHSAAVPRISPDGRYLLFTRSSYGQFHIWHKDADLYVKDLTTGEVRPLDKANSDDADSYHTWSSNGRWLVVASRRDDGNYSRPYIAYFDKEGRDYKAFLVPQEDPSHDVLLLKSYNVPELTRHALHITPEALRAVVDDDRTVKKVTTPASR